MTIEELLARAYIAERELRMAERRPPKGVRARVREDAGRPAAVVDHRRAESDQAVRPRRAA